MQMFINPSQLNTNNTNAANPFKLKPVYPQNKQKSPKPTKTKPNPTQTKADLTQHKPTHP